MTRTEDDADTPSGAEPIERAAKPSEPRRKSAAYAPPGIRPEPSLNSTPGGADDKPGSSATPDEPDEPSDAGLALDDTVLNQPLVEPPANASHSDTRRKAKSRSAPFGKPTIPTSIGRFRVEGKIGSGGMGAVYEAFDDSADCRVAIKVLLGQTDHHLEQRLRREAKALARLAHPHIVQVYEVGTTDQGLFIAMERIDGQTLQQWRSKSHSWSECLRVYLQAGRGLQAAHDEGLVHRDFKPANCIIDDEGTVRVLDFGLARDTGASSPAPEPDLDLAGPSFDDLTDTHDGVSGRSSSGLGVSTTQTGTVLGTLAYMAPEQLMGRPAEPRSDQFGFCVSLYEAIYGVRPFQGHSPMRLLYSINQGTLREGKARPDPPVPPWLHRALRRGLSPRAEDRFASMAELLDHLGRVPRRRRLVVGAAVVVGLVAVGATVTASLSQSRPCERLQDEQAVSAWTAERQAAVEAGLNRADAAAGAQAWTQAQTHLDLYADQWLDARRRACEQTHVEHTASEQTLALRMACLDRQMSRMAVAVEQLAQADAVVVAHAPLLVRSLPPVEPCLDADAPAPVAEALDEPVAEVRTLIDRSWTARIAGRIQPGLDAAETAVEQARAIEQAPRLLAEALVHRGHLYRHAHRLAEAREDLEAALTIADRLDDERLAVDALTGLVVVSVDGHDRSASRAYLASARGRLLRHDDPRSRARLQTLESQVGLVDERFVDAATALHEAAQLYGQLGPTAHHERARALVLLGQAHRGAGQDDDALRVLADAMTLAEHERLMPMVATIADELGDLYFTADRADEAEPHLRRSIALRETLVGSRSPSTIRSRVSLAKIHHARGELDKAAELATLAQESLGPQVSAPLKEEVVALIAALQQAKTSDAEPVE